MLQMNPSKQVSKLQILYFNESKNRTNSFLATNCKPYTTFFKLLQQTCILNMYPVMLQCNRCLKDKKTVVITGGVLRTQPNIYDAAFFQK